jgi:hypothetical protein
VSDSKRERQRRRAARGRRDRQQRRGVPDRRGSAVFWLVWWAVSYALWVGLVFKTEPAELAAGAVAAAFAATAAEVVRAQGRVPFSPDRRWLRALGRLPAVVAVDTARLTAAVWRRAVRGEPLSGSMRVVHFDDCGGKDPRSEARRAFAKWLGGVGPNSYVVGFDEDHDAVLVHQLVRTENPPPLDPERPI